MFETSHTPSKRRDICNLICFAIHVSNPIPSEALQFDDGYGESYINHGPLDDDAMEMIRLPKNTYDLLKSKLARSEALEQLDFDLIGQFEGSLEDVKSGRIRRVA